MTCIYDRDEQCLGACPNCPRNYADPERAGGYWVCNEEEEE